MRYTFWKDERANTGSDKAGLGEREMSGIRTRKYENPEVLRAMEEAKEQDSLREDQEEEVEENKFLKFFTSKVKKKQNLKK